MKKIEPKTYLILLFLVLLIFYWPYLTGKRSFFYEDLSYFFEPLCKYIGERIASGNLPLWNPYNYCGMSQLAIGSPGIFYPFNWLFALLPFNKALAIIMISNQIIISCGSYLLLSSLAWNPIAAIAGSLALACSGYMFSLSNNYTLLTTAAWIPLSLFFSNRLIHCSQKNKIALFTFAQSFTIAMMLNGGRPEIWLPSLLIMLVYVLYNCLNHINKSERITKLWEQFRAIFIGLLFAMPSILPTIEWLPLSRRSEGLNANEIMMFSSTWYDLLCMIAPHPLGDLQFLNSEIRPLIYPGNMGPYCGSAFLGPIVFVLSLISICQRGSKLFYLTLLFCFMSTISSMGENIPYAKEIAEHIPLVSLFRFPSKLLFFSTICLSYLAARGLNIYLKNDISLKSLSKMPILIFTCLLAIGLFLALSPQIVLPFFNLELNYKEYAPIALSAQHKCGFSLVLSSISAIAYLFFLILLKKHSRHKVAAILSCLIIVVCQIYDATLFCKAKSDRNYYKKPSTLANYLTPRFCALYLERFTVPPAYAPEEKNSKRELAFEYTREVLRPFVNIDYKLASMFGFEGSMNGEYFHYILNAYLSSSQAIGAKENNKDLALARFMQSAACNQAVTQAWRYLSNAKIYPRKERTNIKLLDKEYFELIKEDERLNFRIYNIKQAMPRAYLSFNYLFFTESQRNDLLNCMFFAKKSNFDPAQITLVESDNAKQNLRKANNFIGASYEAVKIVELNPENIIIDCNAKNNGVLVLADQYYPGWEAKIDGQAIKILRCNGFFRAVEINPGKHHIEFSYKPQCLNQAFLLSLLGLLWLIFIAYQNKKTII